VPGPLISVIIPVLNGASTIAQTLESVLNQTVTDLEIIVIDDGSTDGTHEILERYRTVRCDYRIRVLRFPNAGVSISRNRGLQQAEGGFVSFIDADDLWDTHKLERQIGALQTSGGAGVAYSFTRWIDEDGRDLRGGLEKHLTGDVYRELLLQDFIGSGSNPLISRDCFDRVGGFDPDLHPAEDWDMWLRLAAQYPFFCVPHRDVLYRKSATSASSNVSIMAQQSVRIVDRECVAQAHRLPAGFRSKVFASRYEYLMFKCLERPLSRVKARNSLGFFLRMLRYDWAFLLRGKMLAVTLSKITLGLLCPAVLARHPSGTPQERLGKAKEPCRRDVDCQSNGGDGIE
jgi:glycosyltransferase involved in cell wall biosynthesis